MNRFPDFVHGLVAQLRAFAPAMGKVRVAQLLARAGLHLAPTTVRRWTRADVAPPLLLASPSADPPAADRRPALR